MIQNQRSIRKGGRNLVGTGKINIMAAPSRPRGKRGDEAVNSTGNIQSGAYLLSKRHNHYFSKKMKKKKTLREIMKTKQKNPAEPRRQHRSQSENKLHMPLISSLFQHQNQLRDMKVNL
jgi:hypothetical protein